MKNPKGFGRQSSAPNQILDDLKLRLRVKNSKVERDTQNDKKTDDMLYGFRQDSYTKVEEGDDNDAMSD